MHTLWIVAGVGLTLFLAVMAFFYLALVVSLWCSGRDDEKDKGSNP